LLSAKALYNKQIEQPHNKAFEIELDSVYTHNLFYLAQAYGNIGDSEKSSEYCHETLQRQLNAGLVDLKYELEWVKNCCGISDFYSSMKQYNNCALALSSAETVLKNAKGKLAVDIANNNQSYLLEIEAEVHKKWTAFYVKILKRAFEIENEKMNALLDGRNEIILETDNEKDFQVPISIINNHNNNDHNNTNNLATAMQIDEANTSVVTNSNDGNNIMNVDNTEIEKINLEDIDKNIDKNNTNIKNNLNLTLKSRLIASYLSSKELKLVSFFENLPIAPITLLNSRDIETFENARIVFLRAVTHLEAAKKYYILDGLLLIYFIFNIIFIKIV
jgi:hypothetical protein